MNKISTISHLNIARCLSHTFCRHFSAQSPPKAEPKPRATKSKERARLESIYKEFPEKFLRRNRKIPSAIYVADEEGADIIAKKTFPYLEPGKTIVEVNPGPGHLTKKFLELDNAGKILLFEHLDFFLPNLEELHSIYPDKIKVKQGDLINIWKLAFRDKLDHGSRIADLLIDIPKADYDEDSPVALFGAVGSYNFFKHLINSLVFQSTYFQLGRFEMFLAIPPPIYIHLTCRNDIGYLLYRSTSILFQIMFEYEFIDVIPRDHFLPRPGDHTLNKGNKLTKVKSINPEFLYLVRITPRKNLYDLCPPEDMHALWFFTKQNMVSRRNRIIPNLEKLIPGSGPRLIVNPNKPVPVKNMPEYLKNSNLPPYSHPCTTMSTKDYYPHLNIYTQFGDLSPSQMLTLFCQFRSWPEFKQSSFLASLEVCLLKMESVADENVMDIAEEDDQIAEEEEEIAK